MILSPSARRDDFASSATAVARRPPGRQGRTNTTRPSLALATQPPPAAIGPASRSRSGILLTCRLGPRVVAHSSGCSWSRQLTAVPARLQVPVTGTSLSPDAAVGERHSVVEEFEQVRAAEGCHWDRI